MKEYFLKGSELNNISIFTENRQNLVDESQVNQAFEPANDIFEGIRETGYWIFDFVSDFTNQVAAFFSNSF